VELQFSEDGYTFVGKWKDDSTGQWGDWRGRRIESVAEILAIPLRLLVRKKPAYCDHVRGLSRASLLLSVRPPSRQSHLMASDRAVYWPVAREVTGTWAAPSTGAGLVNDCLCMRDVMKQYAPRVGMACSAFGC
jgi:hypothetical protein